jgi:hypothetical protein
MKKIVIIAMLAMVCQVAAVNAQIIRGLLPALGLGLGIGLTYDCYAGAHPYPYGYYGYPHLVPPPTGPYYYGYLHQRVYPGRVYRGVYYDRGGRYYSYRHGNLYRKG